jgi:PAS domain-containing protein
LAFGVEYLNMKAFKTMCRPAAQAIRPASSTDLRLALIRVPGEDAALDALGTWIYDVGRGSLTCSEEITDIVGLAPGELDGHARSFLALMRRDRRRAFAAKMLSHAGEGSPFTERLELQGPDGQACLVRLSGRPLRDTGGRPRWIVGTLSMRPS